MRFFEHGGNRRFSPGVCGSSGNTAAPGGVQPRVATARLKSKERLLPIVLLVSLAAAGAGSVDAADWNLFGSNGPDIEFHGFASQGFIGTTGYNYLGDTKSGSLEFSEFGLNAAFNPFARTRIMAQAFSDDVGSAGRYDAVLDYALAEYTFNDYIGIRAGRIRRPQGIYNDIQDVDLGRTFVLLPQGVYDARYRDFYVSLDGAEIFGAIPLEQAGTLAYELYTGVVRPSVDGGIALDIRNDLPITGRLDEINSPTIFGGQLWWSTPIDGLRLGASGGYVPGFDYTLTVQSPVGPIHLDEKSDVIVLQYSAEYLWKAWTFQNEYWFTYSDSDSPGVPDASTFSWYVSAEYRFNKWIAAGAYYSEYYNTSFQPSGAGTGVTNYPSDANQRDAAVAVRFDLTDRWLFKVEGHYLRGTGLLEDNVNNPVRRDNGWWMLDLKTTISF